jgi:hypothetical protein
LFLSLLFLTRHYDRIYQRRRFKNRARWWSHRMHSRDIFRRNGFDSSSFLFFLSSAEARSFLTYIYRYIYMCLCS